MLSHLFVFDALSIDEVHKSFKDFLKTCLLCVCVCVCAHEMQEASYSLPLQMCNTSNVLNNFIGCRALSIVVVVVVNKSLK